MAGRKPNPPLFLSLLDLPSSIGSIYRSALHSRERPMEVFALISLSLLEGPIGYIMRPYEIFWAKILVRNDKM